MRLAAFAGWTMAIVLWETTALALLVAGWRLLRPAGPARAHYASGIVALAVALILAAVTPLLLLAAPTERRTPLVKQPIADESRVAVDDRPTPLTFASATDRGLRIADTLASAAGIIWLTGVIVLSVRLAGGWIRTALLRRRARRLTNTALVQRTRALEPEIGIRRSVELLQSPDLEAPVAVGWRRPALILPDDVASQFSEELIEPLLAHELAHVQRRDYAVNLAQSVVEALLFFSPGVVWIARHVREYREYCCDDIASDRLGDSARLAQSLTTLAALGSLNRARPALGAVGPRLIVRIRRLLKGDVMPAFNRFRVALVVVCLVAVAATGRSIAALSAAHAASALVAPLNPQTADGRLPYFYATEQKGSYVGMHLTFSDDRTTATARLRNLSKEPIVSVTFLTAVEEVRGSAPVHMFTTEVAVAIAPGAEVNTPVSLVTAEQLQQLTSNPAIRVQQLFVGLTKVRFANGAQWAITPNPAARSGNAALGLNNAPPTIPREATISNAAFRQIRDTLPPSPGCLDMEGHNNTTGALIHIADEPGHNARCDSGKWVEVQKIRVLITPAGRPTTALTVTEGAPGLMDIQEVGRLLIEARFNGPTEDVLTVSVTSIPNATNMRDAKRLGEVDVTIGGPPQELHSTPSFTIAAP